ncbi:MAG: GLPGLI family protein [Flaviramulus sp.]|nr:GLPGLI family protein [Flaviramulus sp.]NNC51369.1 GLPGLI family protein [Flaviramulus sp.]
MKTLLYKLTITVLILFTSQTIHAQEFQGRAYYFSKTPMDLGTWGARMSEAQKKQVAERLKNRLEKTYILVFNKEESVFYEDEKLDAISGATDSWGKNFTPGKQYKNVKTYKFIQNQEFYGKQFLVKENLSNIDWEMGSETKIIGQYTCFKATSKRPVFDISWWNFSWSNARNNVVEKKIDSVKAEDMAKVKSEPVEEVVDMVEIEAWYTPMIPVSQGPGDYWGLPGLILEVNVGNTTLLCSKIVMNPKEKIKIEAPDKGKEVTKKEYQEIITGKMQEMRNNRGRRRN